MNDARSDTVEVRTTKSHALVELKDHQNQVQLWLFDVKKKIYEIETSYLEETQLGNIVRGWEIDGKVPNPKLRGHHDDKERLFSYSSYETWLEHRKGSVSTTTSFVTAHDNGNATRQQSYATSSQQPLNSERIKGALSGTSTGRPKKSKKRKADFAEEWDQPGDY